MSNSATDHEQAEDTPQQPEVDNDRLSHVLVLVSGTVASLACLGSGIYFAVNSNGRVVYVLPPALTDTWADIIAFAVNTALTQCFECLNYIHSLSLRWTLFKEDRLQFNTNLRLFSSSQCHGPNAWYSNVVSALCLVLGYAATSQLFLKGLFDVNQYRVCLNSGALLLLGSVILIQSALGLWCLLFDPSATRYWTSNALNSALLAVRSGEIAHHEGRCMLPASMKDTAANEHISIIPIRPSKSQPRMRDVRPATMWIVYGLWALAMLGVVWFAVLVLESRKTFNDYGLDWTFKLLWTDTSAESYGGFIQGVGFNVAIGSQKYLPFPTVLLLGFLFAVAIQMLQTLGLQAAELIVITARDEDVWRQLAKHNRGSRSVLKKSPFFVALLSWKNIVLTICKSFLHWLMGQCTPTTIFNGIEEGASLTFVMLYTQVLLYALSVMVFALFITFLAVKRPSGPQPAAWGHIPTLANLIDDWETDDYGRMWWGDKGAKGNVRHAGTSHKRDELQNIRMEATYL